MDNTLTQDRWNTGQKILFRFFALYLFLYIFPFPLNFVAESAWQSVGSMLDPFVNWVAHTMLHFKQQVHADAQNGSGDTSYYYVQVYIVFLLAIIATIVWSVLDSKRGNYTKLLYWTKVLVRYYLAFFLLNYGFSKFNGGQFPPPHLERLMQPYGKSSPMGLAWTFLGFSKVFGIFMGISECMGGVLMLFRRTTLFGACIATTVVTNIVMINLCYDVPVKIFSAHLLLMCLFVLVTEGSRFLNVFILNRPTQPLDLTPVFQTRKLKITRIVIKSLLILAFLGLPVLEQIQDAAAEEHDEKVPLYGIYNVAAFVRNNETIPPLTTDSTRWSRFVVPFAGRASIHSMTEKSKYYACIPDTIHHTITMYSYKDSTTKYHLSYQKADSSLYLSGRFEKDSIYVQLQRFDEHKYLLMNRGFHWINEYPMNR